MQDEFDKWAGRKPEDKGLETQHPKDPETGEITPHLVAGMRQGPDGKWYIPDPNRPGKYLQVMEK